jgi:hypothetical protein
MCVCTLVLQESTALSHLRDESARAPVRRARRPQLKADSAPSLAQEPPVIVGINRPLYEEAAGREYTCARGLRCLVTSDRAQFPRAFAVIDVLKDPRKVGPLDFRTAPGQLRGVVIAEKDEAKLNNRGWSANRYDFEVGYNQKTACMWKPFMCNEVEKYSNRTLFDEIAQLPDRTAAVEKALDSKLGKVVAFVSNCGGVPWRRAYLQELMEHIQVDSYGTCLHNADLPECPYTKEQARRLPKSNPCARRGTHNVVKLRTTARYKFLFAFENQQESHYVTEKPYDGLRVATLPIYRGAPEVFEHVPAGSIVLADRFKSPKELADLLHYLDRNRSAYLEYFKWRPSAFAESPAGRRCPWQCRVCEMKYDLKLQQRCRQMAGSSSSG